MTSEIEGVATRIDQQLNPHVSGLFPPPPQVRVLARFNLSRWKHGFEPRLGLPRSEAMFGGYEDKRPRIGPAAYTGPSRCPYGFPLGARARAVLHLGVELIAGMTT